jgi:hypothetical protein
VKPLSGHTLCFRVNSFDSVASFKDRIRISTGIPLSLLWLFFKGKQLQDNQVLHDYGLDQNSMIFLVSSLLGGDKDCSSSPSTQLCLAKNVLKPYSFKAIMDLGHVASSHKELSGFAFLVEHWEEPPKLEVNDPKVDEIYSIYALCALICRFNGFLPLSFALREWIY